jgi:UDP-N-acetylmuramoyl-tripeptide--D-alanyl-D-alanine ligase
MNPDRVCVCEDNAAAIECLLAQIEPGDYILIKGSRGMKMEEIVTALGKG